MVESGGRDHPFYPSNLQDHLRRPYKNQLSQALSLNTQNPALPDATNLGELKRKSVRGGAVVLVAQATTVAIQLTSTVVLARLLMPDDYGVLAMVMAITGFAGLFRDLGLSAAAIQKPDLSRPQQSNLFWLNVAMGALLTAIVAACSPLVAWFYGSPELTLVTLALSASFLISSLGTQHGARLIREMQFARQAVSSISGALVSLAVSIFLASLGFSYWALVWGILSGGLTSTLALFVLSPFRPEPPSRGTGIREMLKFGANVTGFEFVNYFHRNLDNILIGRFWGAEALGLYSRAYQLLMFPIQNIRGPINTVAFPALSKLRPEPEAYRAYYRRVSSIVAFISMPLCGFLFVSSGPIIQLALGNQWLGVVPIFSVLAISGFIQPVASLRGLVMLSTARGSAYLNWGIFNAVAVSLAFVLGVPWGAIGVASSYAIVNYAILYPSLILAFKDTPLRTCDFFEPLLRPVVASLVAIAIGFAITHQISALTAVQTLGINILTFSVSYFATFVITPGGAREIQRHAELWRQFTTQRKVSA